MNTSVKFAPVAQTAKVAHFYSVDNDNLYLSKNTSITVSSNELIQLKNEIYNVLSYFNSEIAKAEEQLAEASIDHSRKYEAMETITKDISTTFKTYFELTGGFFNTNLFDVSHFEKKFNKEEEHLKKRMESLLVCTFNELVEKGNQIKSSLKHYIAKYKNLHKTFEHTILDRVITLITALNHRNKTVAEMEKLVEEFEYDCQLSCFQEHFLDFHLKMVSYKVRHKQVEIKKERLAQLKLFKQVMKLRSMKKPLSSYLELFTKWEEKCKDVDRLFETLKSLERVCEDLTKKYRTGYETQNYVYKLKPFYENVHKKEMEKVKKMINDTKFAHIDEFIWEIEEKAMNSCGPFAELHYGRTSKMDKFWNMFVASSEIKKEISLEIADDLATRLFDIYEELAEDDEDFDINKMKTFEIDIRWKNLIIDIPEEGEYALYSEDDEEDQQAKRKFISKMNNSTFESIVEKALKIFDERHC